MIFPDIRVSDLRKEAAAKRAVFESSKQRLAETFRSKTRPLTFIKEHPQLIFGSLFTLLSAFSPIERWFGKSHGEKKGVLGRLVKVGWAWKLFKMGKSVYRTFSPADEA